MSYSGPEAQQLTMVPSKTSTGSDDAASSYLAPASLTPAAAYQHQSHADPQSCDSQSQQRHWVDPHLCRTSMEEQSYHSNTHSHLQLIDQAQMFHDPQKNSSSQCSSGILTQPRSCTSFDDSSVETMSGAYPPSSYQVDYKPEFASTMDDYLPAPHFDYNFNLSNESFTSNRWSGDFTSLNPSYVPMPYFGLENTDSRAFDELDCQSNTCEHIKRDEMTSELQQDTKDEPYAQLIHRALLHAPDNQMVLKDIYEWFTKNTDKASEAEVKGWQNSIRHNLSMNGAFQKVDNPDNADASKKGYLWKLTQDAIKNGVKSTTRYRQKNPKGTKRRCFPATPQRQASGAKGGAASRKSGLRRSARTPRELGSPSSIYTGSPTRMNMFNAPSSHESLSRGGHFYQDPNSPYANSGAEDELSLVKQESGCVFNVDPFAPTLYTGYTQSPFTPPPNMSEPSYPSTPDSFQYGYHLVEHEPNNRRLFGSFSESSDGPQTPPTQQDLYRISQQNSFAVENLSQWEECATNPHI